MPALSPYLQCIVVTPEAQVLATEVFELVLPAHDGMYGIMSGHISMLCKLGSGLLRYQGVKEGEKLIFIGGGFAHVVDDIVAILTPKTITPEDVTFTQAEDEIRLAQLMPTTTEQQYQAKVLALSHAQMLMRLVRGIW